MRWRRPVSTLAAPCLPFTIFVQSLALKAEHRPCDGNSALGLTIRQGKRHANGTYPFGQPVGIRVALRPYFVDLGDQPFGIDQIFFEHAFFIDRTSTRLNSSH